MTVRTQTAITPEQSEHLNTGIVRRLEGLFDEALEHYTDGASLYVGGLASAKYHNGLADTLTMLGRNTEARGHYGLALEYAKDELSEQGITFNNLAFLCIREEKYAEAHEWLNRAEGCFEQAKDTTNLARAQETRSELFQKEFAYRRAFKSALQSGLTLVDGFEYEPLLESLTRIEQVARAYRIQVALEMLPVAQAAVKLGMTRQNLERILSDEFPELEVYARRGKPRGVHVKKS